MTCTEWSDCGKVVHNKISTITSSLEWWRYVFNYSLLSAVTGTEWSEMKPGD